MHREKAEAGAAEQSEAKERIKRSAKAPPSLEEAKLRFYKAAADYTPLGFVQRRPLASVGVAFLAGFGMSALGASRIAPPAMGAVGQIASLVAQFAPMIAARARSSDG